MAKEKEEVKDLVQLVTVRVVETIRGQPRVLSNARVTLSPVFDEQRGGRTLKTGVSEADWNKLYKDRFGDYKAFYEGVKDTTTGRISDGFSVVLTGQTRQFDVSDPYNQLVVALLKAHPYVANTIEELTQESRFVLYDEIEEARKENVAFDSELKAYKYLADMSAVEKAEFLKLYGVKNTEVVSPELVAKRIKDKAKEDPKTFVEMYEDKNKELKILMNDLVANNIIKRIGGVYYFGKSSDGIPLGSSLEQAVEFLRMPKHNDLLVQFKKLLTEYKRKYVE